MYALEHCYSRLLAGALGVCIECIFLPLFLLFSYYADWHQRPDSRASAVFRVDWIEGLILR